MSRDNTVRVWQVTTEQFVQTYSGHMKSVVTVAWSPNGTQIASGSKDKTIRVYTWYPS